MKNCICTKSRGYIRSMVVFKKLFSDDVKVSVFCFNSFFQNNIICIYNNSNCDILEENIEITDTILVSFCCV